MSLTVQVRQLVERVGSGDDAKVVTASRGEELPDGIPSERVQELKASGAIADSDAPAALRTATAALAPLDATGRGANPDGGTEGVQPPDGEGQDADTSSDRLPDDAPNVADASVGELAAYIDSENLNAASTVALAQGSPELAPKVLEAERASSGGDGRSTVVRPLERLAADQGPVTPTNGDDEGGDRS